MPALAEQENQSELVALLLENGAMVDAVDAEDDGLTPLGLTPLDYACYFANSKIAKLLVEHGAQIGTKSLIIAAFSEGNLDEDVKELVKFLLDKGAWVEAQDGSGATALHGACGFNGYLEAAQLLLDYGGAALEAKDDHNETPLHYASWYNQLEVVKELVQRGADIFAKGADDKTPFDEANLEGATEVAEYLLEQYKEKLWEREGRLSLHAILREAANLENNKVQLPIGTVTIDEFLTLLVSIHSQDTDSIRSQDGNRALPIHIACRANAPMKVLRFCVEQYEAMLYMMDSAGYLPIHAACLGGASLDKFKYLVEKGGVGTLGARDNQCALPLHLLCQTQPSVDVVKYLLKMYPLSVSEKTSTGALPFMLACECWASESVLQELLTAHPEALDEMKTYYSLS